MNRWTRLVHFDPSPDDAYSPNNTPIYQTATFAQESADIIGQYDYTRSGNPTRCIAEVQLAKLESGEHGFLFASGMAALTTVVGLLKQGDHLIASDDLYGGTHRLFTQRLAQRGITVTWLDTTDLTTVEQAFTPTTRMVLIETPSNPLQKITDIRGLAKITHKHHALFIVDNSFLSPWLQQPLLLGADVVVHSATKHLSGHSDLTAGVVIVNDEKIAEALAFIQNAEGNALTPFESWLLLRSIKTLGLRIERQQSSAEKIANYLQNHPAVNEIYYTGLESHPGHALNKSQAEGSGSSISFTTGSLALSRHIVEKTRLFTIAVSFGSVASLISLPCAMSHAAIPADQRQIPKDLIRLSIGIEDPDDLIADLEQAFVSAKQVATY